MPFALEKRCITALIPKLCCTKWYGLRAGIHNIWNSSFARCAILCWQCACRNLFSFFTCFIHAHPFLMHVKPHVKRKLKSFFFYCSWYFRVMCICMKWRRTERNDWIGIPFFFSIRIHAIFDKKVRIYLLLKAFLGYQWFY